ncbi:MAG: hypothetical protein JSW17_01415, partial [Candidatus Omnitrophota bacterium]
ANEEQFKEAEKELIKSHNLYPTEVKIDLYLAKYYMKLGQKVSGKEGEWESFKRLMRVIELSGLKDLEIRRDVGGIIGQLPNVSWDDRKRKVIYTTALGSDNYDFKEQGFAHDKIPVAIRLYIKGPIQEVVLYYREYIRFKEFEKTGDIKGHAVYEVKIDSFPEDIYLDDFRIEPHPSTVIEKIEIVKSSK